MSTLFYRYPRLVVLSLALIVAAGLSAYEVLPRREDPELTSRFALVATPFPGAAAERVERLVTDPIEEELAEIEEIGKLESTSRAGFSVIVIELRDEVNEIAEVWSRVRDRIDDARLPATAGEPDFDELLVDAWSLIVGLRWTRSEPVPLGVLSRLGEELEDRLRALNGTKEADLFGAPREELLVDLDPARVAALGLSAEDIAGELARADAKVPAGRLQGAQAELLLEVDGELDGRERVAAVPVRAGPDGRLLRLGDVATITRGVSEPADVLAFLDGQPGVAVAARIRSDVRVDRWAAAARAIVDEFEIELPDDVVVELLFDQSTYTQARLDDLVSNLALGASLVMGVVLLMMGWRAALLVLAALPLSTLMVLAGMRFLGVPIHQMSVTGLIIALGLLIDNAIVMVDETRHRLREEESALAAVGKAVRGLAVPLLGSTLTTVLAFLPLVLAAGPVGEFVGAMSIAVVLAITSSFVISLTILPVLTAWCDRGARESARSWWRDGISIAALERAWRAFLRGVVAHPVLGVVLGLALPVLGFIAGGGLQQQFFPPSGRDQAQIELRLGQLATIDATREAVLRAHSVLEEHPAVERSDWFLGASGPKFYYNMLDSLRGESNYAQALLQLESADDSLAVLRDLQTRLDRALPDAQVVVRQLEQGPPFDAPIEVRLEGEDLNALREVGNELRAELARLERVEHTRTELYSDRPKLALAPRDEELERAGWSRVALANRLSAALDGALGGSIVEGEEELPVRVRLAAADRGDLDAVASLALSGPGGWTPLDALGELRLEQETGAIPHYAGRRANTIQGFLTAGTLPADVLDTYLPALERIESELPEGVRLFLAGEAAERDDAVGSLASSAGILLVAMIATLVLSFRSFRRAAIIGFVGLMAVGLSLGALSLFGHPFGFMAIVGTMGLIGLAINDSIVVMAALLEDEGARRGEAEAIVDTVVRSTRHVLSTTFTTILGFLPLLFDPLSMWPPLATAIAGGVAGATILALILVPALHVWASRSRRRVGDAGAPSHPTALPAPA